MKIKINKGLFGLKTKYLNEAILFAEDYRNSPGFNERWNRIGKIPGTYRTKNSVYNPLSQYEHKLLWKKGEFKKGKYIPWEEDPKNSMYKYGNGDFYIGTSKTPGKAFSNWKDMLTHEAGHYLEESLNNPTLIYKDSYTINSPLNFYSEIYPVFRKSNSYKNVLNFISGDKEDVSEYNRNPVTKSWSFNYDWGTNDLHDASPSESYADLFLLRKKLLDSGIYDSRKANNLFKQEHLDKFKKLNKDKIRLFDNFSDKDIIWMMNNIAQNNKILSTLLNYYAKKGGSIKTANARKWKHKEGGKAFINGVNVLDSNPKAYKYVKKKYKMAQQGTKLNFFLKAGNWLSNNGDLVKSIANAGLGILSSILLNKAIDSQIEANKKLMEANKQRAFMENYKKALGLQTDRSDIINMNRAWLIANSLDYSGNEELMEENALLENSRNSGLLDSLGGLASSILNSPNFLKKSNNGVYNLNIGNTTYNWKTNTFTNKNKAGTINSNGSMNTGIGGTTYNWNTNTFGSNNIMNGFDKIKF